MDNMQAPALAHQVSRKQRLLLTVAGGLIGLLAIITLAVIFFGRGSSEPFVTKVILQQEELLRVNELADKFQPSLAVRHIQSTIAGTITSDMAIMQELPNNAKGAVSQKGESTSYVDTEAEARFESAAQRNAFEREYRSSLTDHLTRIQASLVELRDFTKSDQLKDQVGTLLEHCDFLLDMLSNA